MLGTTNHCFMLNIQALVIGFREDFYVFPIISLWEIMTSPVCGLFGPQRHGRQDV